MLFKVPISSAVCSLKCAAHQAEGLSEVLVGTETPDVFTSKSHDFILFAVFIFIYVAFWTYFIPVYVSSCMKQSKVDNILANRDGTSCY
jgi:hypothetical protein